MLTIAPTVARRLAITRQRLAGPHPSNSVDSLLEVVRDLGCLQLDPTNAVARSHLLVLWSRLGAYDPAHLEALLWQQRQLFEYWAHAASIVLTEEYPIHHLRMRRHGTGDSDGARQVRAWMDANDALRRQILDTLHAQGPLPARAFDDTAAVPWRSSGWTGGRNVDRMLAFLWGQGKIMVAGRAGNQKLWDTAERHLPAWTPREELDEREVVRRAAQKSLRALGVARTDHIERHYTRDRYPGLPETLAALDAEGRIVRVQIGDATQTWPGTWYVHSDDLPTLDRLAAGEWEPRTTLLSPFDNLICDRQRTETLFNFSFRLEIYVPRAQRRYGYYVLPILHGDRLIGRADPVMDRKRGRLTVHAVHAEPDAPTTREAARAIANAIADLASFLGAREIAYGEVVPDAWKAYML